MKKILLLSLLLSVFACNNKKLTEIQQVEFIPLENIDVGIRQFISGKSKFYVLFSTQEHERIEHFIQERKIQSSHIYRQ
jgi:hypothetical protein